ncbi:TylF/MycF/NovP-related O-methyltransferase [Candidatus Pelagibacter sp. HIMB1521]|uniref:TylF/MycF/NovP-related O-methyltransferase n=1 Tax=Candidatus Pelagibacter sp. HIMB1521 TaxID=3413344 RepID=UPI003F828CFF
MKIVELSNNDNEMIKTISRYSMTPKIRIFTLIQSLKHVNQKNIDGDFVECGVWKGGNIILFKKFLEKEFKNKNKTIYAYDTFEGMTEPTSDDYDLKNNKKASQILKKDKSKKSNSWGVCTIENVKRNILNETGNLDNIKFIKGNVEDTLNEEKNLPLKISILRLDTDWYLSTKKELEVMFSRVISGGIIIIDDYGHWSGSKKAVDEFFKDKYVWMHYVDYACRLIIKD